MKRCGWCGIWHTEPTFLCAECEWKGQQLNNAKGGHPAERRVPFDAFTQEKDAAHVSQ